MLSVVAWFGAVVFGLFTVGLTVGGVALHAWQFFVGAAAMAVMTVGWVLLARHWAHPDASRVLYDGRTTWIIGVMLLALVAGALTMSTLG